MPHAFVDAAVSRQMIATISTVQHYASTGVLANDVVIGLGTNGPFSSGDFDKMMQAIGLSVRFIGSMCMCRRGLGKIKSTPC